MRRSPRGFLLIDILLGLAVIGIITGCLFTAISQQQLATTRLAHRRAAVAAAEEAMMTLKTGRAVSAVEAQVEAMTDDAPAGYAWMRVTASVEDQQAMMIGLVRQGGGR